MYKENKTQTEIVKSIGVSKSTICRELKRNMRPHGSAYNYKEAHLVSQPVICGTHASRHRTDTSRYLTISVWNIEKEGDDRQ